MKAQHYKVPATPEHLEFAKPGQFVFENDDSDEVCGFIDFLSDCEIAFMFFEPVEVKVEGAIVIQEQCNYLERLKEILEDDPEMRQYWTGEE